MNNVIYGGKSFEVPPYVEYVAADRDGKVYGYSIKPKFDGSEGCWYVEYGTGCSAYLGELDAVENAPTYLTRVEAIRAPKKKPKETAMMSNKNEVFEYLIDQLRQQVNNNRCEDLAHEVQSLKNQLRDALALVDELQKGACIPSMASPGVNSAAWKLYDALVAKGPINGAQFNILKVALYDAMLAALGKSEADTKQSGGCKEDTQECSHPEGHVDTNIGFCSKCGNYL